MLALVGSAIVATPGLETLGRFLQAIGVGAVVTSTVTSLLADYYRRLRRETITSDIDFLATELKSILEHPNEFKGVVAVARLRAAGVLEFFPNRKDAATAVLKSDVERLRDTPPGTTVRLMGDSLRVFFHPGSDFTVEIHQAVTSNSSHTAFQVLILDPLCANAVARSAAEVSRPYQDMGDYKLRSALYHDATLTLNTIEHFNEEALQSGRDGDPIEVRLYDLANMCLLCLFPDVAYTSQYVYADARAQVQTARLPMLLFGKDAEALAKYRWHFEYVWKHAQPPSELRPETERWMSGPTRVIANQPPRA